MLYLQNFLAANSQCWWNGPLTAATRALKYAGHVAPGMLLVTAEPCALEVLRGAYARSVLKPPATYVISAVGKSQKAYHTNNYSEIRRLLYNDWCFCCFSSLLSISIWINGWRFKQFNKNAPKTIRNCLWKWRKKINRMENAPFCLVSLASIR